MTIFSLESLFMRIKIKDTGEIKELQFLDSSKTDHTRDFLSASKESSYYYDYRNDLYITDKMTFNLWETISNTLQKINERSEAPTINLSASENTKMTPTNEQNNILNLFNNNSGDLKINAYAGTGKTTTLRLITEDHPELNFLYLAFNKALQSEASAIFPDNVKCLTTHGLAYRSLKIYDTSWQQRLRREPPEVFESALSLKKSPFSAISSANLLTAIRETINSFCRSASDYPEAGHIPFWIYSDHPLIKNEIMNVVLEYAQKLWNFMTDPDHSIPVTHDFYLKYWQLKNPDLSGYDCLLFDEAQDANQVTLKVISDQSNIRRIYVGDQHQQIYSWRGAVNAMNMIQCPLSAELTQSFRFGTEVAKIAKTILSLKGEFPDIKGLESIQSVLKNVNKKEPFTTICRTNTGLIEEALTWADKRKKISVVGGIEEPVRKIKSAYFLYINKKQYITDPEIKAYSSWENLKEASKLNDQFEIKRIVKFIQLYKKSVPDILETLVKWASYSEDECFVTLTTGHKSKGREWQQVIISEDFADVFEDDNKEYNSSIAADIEEINLLYVVATRAKFILEIPRMLSQHILKKEGAD